MEFPDYSEQTAESMLGTNPMLEAGLMGFLGIRHTGCGAGWIVAELDGLRVERAERLELPDAVDTVVRAVRV